MTNIAQPTDARNAPSRLNYGQSHAYVAALTQSDPNIAVIDIRFIHDSDKTVPAIPRRGTLPQLWPEIVAWNSRGYGIFCTISEMDGAGRYGISNVDGIRCQAIDLDNLSAMQNYQRAVVWNPPPSFAVQSSPGKAHVYWQTIRHNDRVKFTLLQRKLRTVFDGDKSIVDASRVLRLPGTLHLKNLQQPHLVRCWALDGYGKPLDPAILEIALANVNVTDGLGGRHDLGEPSMQAPTFELAIRALQTIDPNNLERGEWISVTSAFKQCAWNFATEPQLFDIWSQWCARYATNDPQENIKNWQSIRNTEVGWKSFERRVPEVHAQALFGDKREQRKLQDKIIGDDLNVPTLPDILTLDQALSDLVFIGDGSHVINRKTKNVRKFNDAQNEYAASFHSIATDKLDKDGRPIVKTVPVLKAWIISKARTSVDVVTWQPGQPEFCRAPEKSQAGDNAYNLWLPPRLLTPPPNWQEWVKPFLDHVHYLIPIEFESACFLQWLAHIFQKPGELPHVCYLMIATTTGIGRGTLASILTRALRGYVAANMSIEALFGGFNGRISQKLLATVDEVREGNSTHRYEKQEAFKSKITEETRSLNPKYGVQSVEKNCCRWLLFSNHLDALPFDNGDRRVIVIENPEIRAHPQWYQHLHDLLDNRHFIASVQYFLATVDISTFNPHEPAPMNAIKQKALLSMESEADNSARQFAATWPGELATIADLREFIGEDAKLSPKAMSYVIDRAGMRSAHKQRVAGVPQKVLIVKGAMGPDDLRKMSNEKIADTIIQSQIQFRTAP